MGLDLDTDINILDERITIDIERQRALGMHMVEYADRKGLTRTELKDMLRMLGL